MNIDALGSGWFSALALVALMGFRHGFDADHIAVVDGMTRARQLHGSYWSARLVGLQFALGHSAVIGVAALVFFGQRWAVPQWLAGLGMAVSIGFLLFIAAANFSHAFSPAAGGARPLGPMSAALFKLTGRQLHPALVGMAFALSFDSMAQAAFFATRAGQFSGWGAVGLMATVFGLGMVVADAANGLLLSWCAQRSDRLAQHASRFSSGFIACIALATAAAGLLRESRAGFAQSWDAAGVWVGVGLLLFTMSFYSLRLLLQRLRASPASAAAGPG